MKELLLPENTLRQPKEYLNYPSLILREVKSCKLLSEGAKHCWELLFDLSKFDANRILEISINKIREILLNTKSYRTIQRYIQQLYKNGFLQIKDNYDAYGRIQNTYLVQVPVFILNKLQNSTCKVYIKTPNMASNPDNPRYDNFVQGNKDLNIKDINNCYLSDLEEKNEIDNQADQPIEKTDASKIRESSEVLEYYPAEHKPESLAKAVLRHTLQQPVKFEAVINDQLTQAQEFIVSQVTRFWTAVRYVSSPRECTEWIKAVLLNPKALSQCGNSFLKKMNVIIKMIREKRFTKPFAQRYKEKVDYQKDQSQPVVKPQIKSCEGLALLVSAISPSIPKGLRKTHQEQEKSNRIEAFKAQIALAQSRFNSPDIQTDEVKKQSLFELIQILYVRMQEAQYA